MPSTVSTSKRAMEGGAEGLVLDCPEMLMRKFLYLGAFDLLVNHSQESDHFWKRFLLGCLDLYQLFLPPTCQNLGKLFSGFSQRKRQLKHLVNQYILIL